MGKEIEVRLPTEIALGRQKPRTTYSSKKEGFERWISEVTDENSPDVKHVLDLFRLVPRPDNPHFHAKKIPIKEFSVLFSTKQRRGRNWITTGSLWFGFGRDHNFFSGSAPPSVKLLGPKAKITGGFGGNPKTTFQNSAVFDRRHITYEGSYSKSISGLIQGGYEPKPEIYLLHDIATKNMLIKLLGRVEVHPTTLERTSGIKMGGAETNLKSFVEEAKRHLLAGIRESEQDLEAFARKENNPAK